MRPLNKYYIIIVVIVTSLSLVAYEYGSHMREIKKRSNEPLRSSFLCSEIGFEDQTDDFISMIIEPTQNSDRQYEEWKLKNSNGSCNNVDKLIYSEPT